MGNTHIRPKKIDENEVKSTNNFIDDFANKDKSTDDSTNKDMSIETEDKSKMLDSGVYILSDSFIQEYAKYENEEINFDDSNANSSNKTNESNDSNESNESNKSDESNKSNEPESNEKQNHNELSNSTQLVNYVDNHQNYYGLIIGGGLLTLISLVIWTKSRDK